MTDKAREVDFIIFDLETLDKVPSAIVLSLGVTSGNWDDISFDGLLEHGEEHFFKAKEQQVKYERTLSTDTVQWWAKQQEDAKRIFKAKNKKSISELPTLLWEYVKKNNLKKGGQVLTRGNHFDVPIINDIFQQFNMPECFPWWMIRDVRSIIDTIYGTCNGYPPNKSLFLSEMREDHELVKHNALHDTIIDVIMLKKAYDHQRQKLCKCPS